MTLSLRGIVVLGLLAFTHASAQLIPPSWDAPAQWTTQTDAGCTITVSPYAGGQNGDGLAVQYQLKPGSGWVILRKQIGFNITQYPVTFLLKASSTDNLELKFNDGDGSVFGRKVALSGYTDWSRVTLYLNNTSYWWGGDKAFGVPASFEIAVSGTGSGSVWIDEIGEGTAGSPPTFSPAGPVIDPDWNLAGIGFKQRRAASMNPEDPLVLEWLKAVQDNSSRDRCLLPAQEGDDQAQTFNNSVVAMAFIVKNERERAERILDFYARATKVDNTDLTLQNFYYNGQARGFYQHVSLSTYHDDANTSDRWMGDMAWLLLAYKMYEKQYASDRYSPIISLIRNLLISYYKPEGSGGYVQHGWRNGDRYLHEASGHHEGNIDCYAVFRLCGEDSLARGVKTWLDNVLLNAVDLPLDLYTWRALAFGQEFADLLNTPEYDLRYRKTLTVGGRQVVGFYHGPDIDQNNIWVDGTGHIACGFLVYGPKERGYFYANQLDSLLIPRVIGGKETRALAYTANRSGGYSWVDTTKGFVSCAAWYILAKNSINPMQLTQSATGLKNRGDAPQGFILHQNYPNPFNPSTAISYQLSAVSEVRLVIFDVLGREVATLVNERKTAGSYTVQFSAAGEGGHGLASGVYLARLQVRPLDSAVEREAVSGAGAFSETREMVLVR